MATLPYITAPGNIEKALNGIKSAATPERVSQDFVKTVLGMKGGTGNQMTSFLKKIGFANTDGTPTEIYKRFRSPDKVVSGRAAAEAIKTGYKPLYVRNEYAHQLTDEQLKGLIIEETGAGADSEPVKLVLSCFKSLKKFAEFSPSESIEEDPAEASNGYNPFPPESLIPYSQQSGVGLNLSYTINLNLPATSDVSVFNAIFKSLKENLLRNE